MKFYATVNRQGTQIRIKESHQLLMSYLLNREVLPPLDENTPQEVVFVTKKDWMHICNELKIGFKESFIKIIDRKNSVGIIIADESMKSEINKSKEWFGFKKDFEDAKRTSQG